MFAAWGSWVARLRWPVFVVTLAAVITAGVWGAGVFGQLSEGGYNDPDSESTRAAETVQEAFGAPGGDVVVIYTPATGSIDDPALAQRVHDRLSALPPDAVSATASYWADQIPQYVSADRRSAVAVLTLTGDDESAKLESFRAVADRLDVAGARTQIAGGAPLADASASLSTRDLAVAEAISLPIVLILLLLVFGSLVAAVLPVLVGGAAVLGSLGVLHAIALTHDVNSFAVNVASLLGLGMAIDYGLFMVGRFREEQEYGRAPAEAVARTVATAGRTVLFSATLLIIALAGLLLFPQGFLKSLAYGGLAAVALAAVLSLTLLPALLAILGPRVDRLPVRLPRRRTARPAGTGWARLADVVLRRPVLVSVPLVIGLLVLAAPIRDVQFGENDERILPASEPSRQAIETLKADFPALSSVGVQVVLRGAQGAAPDAAAVQRFASRVAGVRGIAAVTPAGSGNGVTALTATLQVRDPFDPAARDAVAEIRGLPAPAGTQLLVGGTTARNVDSLEATADRLPLMVSLLVGATLVLMFLAFGSILLPVKAVLVSALSLTATFGILVWVFQEGHGAGLLHVTPAPLEVGIVVLMAAVVFGLSTDYEVFLLSRMVEARTRGATTAEAVTTGLARTGRVISAAALLLIVVTGAFALSSVTTMRFVGVGMIIALILDATVVRMLLVPAILRLLGSAAWWAPGPLRRLQQRAGLAEYAGEELFPTVSVGRHAAPDMAVARSGSAQPRHASRPETPVSPATPDEPTPPPTAVPPTPAPPAPAPPTPAPPTPAPPTPAAAPAPAGDQPSAEPPAAMAPPPEPADLEDRPTVRLGTGERPAVRFGADEQPSVHFVTEPQPTPGLTATPPPTEPSPTEPATGKPGTPGPEGARPSGTGPSGTGPSGAGDASGDEPAELSPTVDLASRVARGRVPVLPPHPTQHRQQDPKTDLTPRADMPPTAGDELMPDPDTTAVLTNLPPVDRPTRQPNDPQT